MDNEETKEEAYIFANSRDQTCFTNVSDSSRGQICLQLQTVSEIAGLGLEKNQSALFSFYLLIAKLYVHLYANLFLLLIVSILSLKKGVISDKVTQLYDWKVVNENKITC